MDVLPLGVAQERIPQAEVSTDIFESATTLLLDEDVDGITFLVDVDERRSELLGGADCRLVAFQSGDDLHRFDAPPLAEPLLDLCLGGEIDRRLLGGLRLRSRVSRGGLRELLEHLAELSQELGLLRRVAQLLELRGQFVVELLLESLEGGRGHRGSRHFLISLCVATTGQLSGHEAVHF